MNNHNLSFKITVISSKGRQIILFRPEKTNLCFPNNVLGLLRLSLLRAGLNCLHIYTQNSHNHSQGKLHAYPSNPLSKCSQLWSIATSVKQDLHVKVPSKLLKSCSSICITNVSYITTQIYQLTIPTILLLPCTSKGYYPLLSKLHCAVYGDPQ